MKYWIDEQMKPDKLIAINNDIFYASNPNEKDLKFFKDELSLGKIPAKLSGIKFSRIRKIDFEENVNSIEIHYDSKDRQKTVLPNEQIKSQLKNALETIGPSYLDRKLTRKTFWELGYSYLIAIALCLFFTMATYDMAVKIQAGWEFQAQGPANFLIAIAAYTGTTGTIALAATIISLISIRLFYVLKNRKTYDRFIYR